MKLNPLEISDAKALEPYVIVPPCKTATSYSCPGLPASPAGYGKSLGTNVKLAPDSDIGST